MEDKKQSHRFLHAFCEHPDVHFETQFDGEEVILVLRAHPITQLPWIFNALIFLILLIILNLFLPIFFTSRQIFVIDIFFIVFIFSYVWFNFLNWFFNVGIVTNERVVDVDFHNILYKEVSATRINKVEDITSKSAGYFGSLFNYGDIFVQTAGTEVNIEFHKVPDPASTVKILNNLMKPS